MKENNLGKTIALLRSEKGLTQAQFGDRLGVSFQAVSKWERGETMPDIMLLTGIADVLDTSVDYLLRGNDTDVAYKGRIKVCDMIAGIQCLKDMGRYLGKNNIIYRYAVDGINKGMNTDIESAFNDDFIFEAFIAEAVIQKLKEGYYVDVTDVKRSFMHEHFRSIVLSYVKQYNIT